MNQMPTVLRNIDGSPDKRRVRPYRVRLRVLFGLISIGILALIVRLVDLQIRKTGFYSGEAARRRLKASLVDTRRGNIYDRRGRILASDKPSFDICVLFSSHRDKNAPRVLACLNEETGRYQLNKGVWLPSIARLSGLPFGQVEEMAQEIIDDVEATKARVVNTYIEKREKPPPRSFKIPEEVSSLPVLRDVDFDLMSWAEVASDNFPGIEVQASTHRSYPYQGSAAHTIGYTAPVRGEEVQKWGESYDGSPYKRFLVRDFIGRTGLERRFNSYLRGERGEIIEEIDVRGERQKILARRPPIPGNDIILTLDIDLQREAETALGKQRGAIVLMDPHNGEILAMASAPRYDLNTFRKKYAKLSADPNRPLVDRAASSAFPPGSLFKVVTTTAGLQTGKLTPSTTFNCQSYLRLGNITFGCWSKWGHGEIDLMQGIEKSCNVYFFNAGRVTGAHALYTWAQKFGLGRKTGVEIVESAGNLVLPKSKGAVYNMSIGQGEMLATPLQVARMMAVVANGGKLVTPHLLVRIVDCHGKEVEIEDPLHKARSLNINRSTIDLLRRALRNVITQGTASRVPESKDLAELGIAGKTGTAETGIDTENQAWFAGFAPYDDPKICFVILMERVPGHGGETCVPIIKPLLEYYFRKWQLAVLN